MSTGTDWSKTREINPGFVVTPRVSPIDAARAAVNAAVNPDQAPVTDAVIYARETEDAVPQPKIFGNTHPGFTFPEPRRYRPGDVDQTPLIIAKSTIIAA